MRLKCPSFMDKKQWQEEDSLTDYFVNTGCFTQVYSIIRPSG